MTKRAKKKQIEQDAIDGVEVKPDAPAPGRWAYAATAAETVEAVAKATTDTAELIAKRAAKWGFGTNVDAYNASREAQSKMRKADKLGDKAAFEHWRGIFRELNRDKKVKYEGQVSRSP